jgi:hypothetical protein
MVSQRRRAVGPLRQRNRCATCADRRSERWRCEEASRAAMVENHGMDADLPTGRTTRQTEIEVHGLIPVHRAL